MFRTLYSSLRTLSMFYVFSRCIFTSKFQNKYIIKRQLLNLIFLCTVFYSSAQTFPDTWEFRGIHASSSVMLPGDVSAPGPEPAGLDTAVLPTANGRLASLVLVDIDNDGDLDMVSGGQDVTGSLFYYENTGTPTVPNFVEATIPGIANQNVANFPSFGFVDLDDDDYDMVTMVSDSLAYFVNVGTKDIPS